MCAGRFSLNNYTLFHCTLHIIVRFTLYNLHRSTVSLTALSSFPQVCDCLLRTDVNGIGAGVEWVAQHYEHGTPITLLGRPIPKLTDAASWAVWKERLLHYYTKEATYDAALFMYCATTIE